MNPWGEVLVGIVILVGLAGIVLPVLPGLVLVVAAVFVWALDEASTFGWIVLMLSVALAVTATVVKYLVPGRKLRDSGIPLATMLAATVGAVIGFFVIPVVGGPIGFLLGIYIMQWSLVGRDEAWQSTMRTAGAVALSIGIELAGGLLIAGLWLVAAIFG